MATLYCVILAGGLGSRLWPLSRATYPKQMFKLNDDSTLFQQTFLRIANVVDDKNIITTTNIKHATAIKEELEEIKNKFGRTLSYKVLTEPEFRNTASAISLAVKYIEDKLPYTGESPIILSVPSDQMIPDKELLTSVLEKGVNLAQEGYIVAFSTLTDTIDENLGYLRTRKSSKLSEIEPLALKVSSFIEKPKTKKAKSEFKGKFYKNTGIYMFRADIFYEELRKHASDIYSLIKDEKIDTTMPSIPLTTYEQMPDISVDFAIMEKTKKLVTIPFNSEWKDIGSWNAIYEASKKNNKGNYLSGKVIDIGSENSLIYSNSKLIATLGLKNTVVVQTEDAIFISDKNNQEGVKSIYKKLNGKNSPAKEIHKTVYRPWGYYTVLEEGNGFLTKCIVVNPQSKLSIQLHHHRSEHWIVLEGQATVIKGETTLTLESGNSVDIEIEEIHSLQNLTDKPIKILEVQQGDILDENDIERLQDIYGRA